MFGRSVLQPLAFTLSLLMSGVSLAQTTPAPSDAGERETGDGEIVVTGSREANASISGLQVEPIRLPQNVRVIDEELIRDVGATRIADIFALSGITQINTNGGSWDNYSIRGFAGDVNTGPDLLINRFNANRGFNAPRDVATVARFEVLKGPASALSGKGEPGGTINIVTKAPRDRAHFGVEVGVATFDQYRGVVDLGGTIANDFAAVRLIAVREDNGTFRDFGGNERILIAPSVALNPNGAVRFLYQLEYNVFDQVFDRGVVSVDGDAKALPRDRFLQEPNDGEFRQRSQQHQGTVTVDLARGVSIEGGGQYRQGSTFGFISEPRFANALSPPDPARPGVRILQRDYRLRDYDFDDLSGRLELAASGRLLGLNHQFRIGTDALRYEQRQLNSVSNGTGYGIDIFNPVYGQPKPPRTSTITEERLRGEAVYAQDLIELGPFSLLLGIRHDWLRQRTVTTAANGTVTTREQSPQATSPRAALTFAPSRQFSIYASYGKSFRYNQGSSLGGAGNPNSIGTPFEPERGGALEAGIKYALLRGQLTGTASVFDIEKRNVLVPGGTFPGSVAIGAARSRGIETDVNLRLGEQVTATAYYAYIDAETTADRNPALVGRSLNNIPKHSGAVFLRWASRGDEPGSVSISGGLTHLGDRPASQFTAAFAVSQFGPGVLPAYTTVQANFGYRLTESLSAQLDVRNAFDTYFLDSSNNDTRIFPGAPRTVRFTLRAEV